jgi:actin-related protein 8
MWMGRLAQGRRGSHVIVIHPGSRYLRVGRASDVTPLTVPNVIARKTINAPEPSFFKGISRPRNGRTRPPLPPPNGDEYAVARASDDPVRISMRTPLILSEARSDASGGLCG